MINEQYPTQEMLGYSIYIGEYAEVLHKQQSYNVAEVSDLFFNEKDEAARDAKLAELLKQPVMAAAYKAGGIAPEKVSEYVDSVLAWDKFKKEDLLLKLYSAYGDAGDDHDYDKANQISDGREWGKISSSLAQSSRMILPMRAFARKQADSEVKTEDKTFPFGRKVLQWLKKYKPDFVIIAAGVCAGLGINYAGNAYISARDKVEAKKHTKETVAQTNTQKTSGKTSTLQLKPEDFRGSPRS